MAHKHRKKAEDALLQVLACGVSVDQAARQCGLCPRTVYRRLDDPDFRQRLQKLRGEMVTRIAGTLTAAATEALRTLLELLKRPTLDAVRLGAARAVLEIGMKVREVVDLQEQMAELERRMSTIVS